MTGFFLKLYDCLHRRRGLRIGLPVLLLIAMGWIGSRVELEEDITGFLPDNPENARLGFVYRHIGIADKIFVRFSVTDTLQEKEAIRERLIEGAERFSEVLDSLTDEHLVKDIQYRVNIDKLAAVAGFLTENMPYFLEAEDYRRIDSIVNAGEFAALFASNRELLISPAGSVLKKSIQTDPFHFALPVLERLKNFQLNDYYTLVDDYIFSKDGDHLMLFITLAHKSSETVQNAALAKAIQKTIAYLPQDIQVQYFGPSLVAVTNAERIKTDAWQTMLLALVLMVGLLGWFFRSIWPLFLVCLPVAFGVALSLTLLCLFKGNVSAIAIGTGAVILGIAVDYSLHYLIHLKHEPDPRMALQDIVSPMLIGNITTVGAFLSLLFISAAAMRDLGLFAAFALVGTILFVLCFMPHWVGGRIGIQKNRWLECWVNLRPEKKTWLVWIVAGITLVLGIYSNDVTFETDFREINYMTPEQRNVLETLSKYTTLGEKSMYHISEGTTLNEALKEYEAQIPRINAFLKEGVLSGVNGIGYFFPSDSLQQVKISRWNAFKEKYGDSLLHLTDNWGKQAGFRPEAFRPFRALWEKEFRVESLSYFGLIQETLLKEYLICQPDKSAIVTLLYAEPGKEEQIYEALDKQPQAFVFDTTTVTKRMVYALSDDFNAVFYICGFLVLFFLWFAFGRLELTFIAFLPMALSWIWILGFMGLAGIHFNIVNIILATFIFGLGDDYTIFIVDGLMYEYAYGRKMLASYKTSVTLSALTMFIGLGTLILAVHPAMRSLAVITVIGMLCVVGIAFIVPPLIFRWLTEKNGRLRLRPVTLRDLLVTVYAFTVFLAGSALLTVYGSILLGIRKPTMGRKLCFHQLLCRVSRWVVDHLPGISSNIVNKGKEDFSKPAVIVCNHQSHIDLMYVLMLSPKLIVLTNEWVWNCPFYGRIIRFADFWPVEEGIENSIGRLRNFVDKGYSIVVFPEGTRSEDCSVRRFHRGAFYLAEQLNIDIIPVVFHGMGHVLPKREFLLRKGIVTVHILPRILPDDVSYGLGYADRSKQVRRLFINEYARMVEESETPSYWQDAVLANYRYKGTAIKREAQRELKNRTEQERQIAEIPAGARIVIRQCGIGAFALLCALVRKDIKIVALDEDADKIAVAGRCPLRPRHLEYRVGKSTALTDEMFDCVI
ncbi:1-acyl-sn-glycerol-3-phosphate acyltransferase [uncultured Odoribacter sp.]|uniref:1-acyl-sn-glycerol-3-phosphate acyltransferase n=1 Tax=uncultured Odoribacter sp. TaxID=876416 RepID=UPI002607F14A|nr:1-acyl-sn-glycerol-3-phosphate acyltransferase [uncultured Odoribacter sp.]